MATTPAPPTLPCHVFVAVGDSEPISIGEFDLPLNLDPQLFGRLANDTTRLHVGFDSHALAEGLREAADAVDVVGASVSTD
jgi:hypothetical protein